MSLLNHVYMTKRTPLLPMLVFAALTLMLAAAHAMPLAAAPAPDKDRAGNIPTTTGFNPDAQCVPDWGLSPSPDVGEAQNQLLGVAALSATNVWAVGTYLGWPYQPIIEHWNGTNWNMTPGPDLPGAGALWGIAAVSANDIWAVGYYDSGNRRWRTLTLHWNGAAWTQIATPNTGAGSSYLFGVTAVSSTDVWAVGSYCCANYQSQTLAMHWDGATWQTAPSPSVAPLSNALYAVAAVAANDVWAVGAYGAYDNRQTLIERWDGNRWNVSGASRPGTLLGITAISANKAWAVGYGGSSFSRQTLILRLTNTGWEVAPSPSPGASDNILYDVAAIADDDVWAVGSFRNSYKSGEASANCRAGGGGCYVGDETLIAHWDGGRWTQIPSPNRAYTSNYLYALAVVSTREMWAVGESVDYYYPYGHTMAARYVGRVAFNDVGDTDYFYEPVRYLYCAGVISGYADNTFRPYNDTTRAQLSKIVVLAQGWPIDTTGGPHFTDVRADNPFYAYVETAYNRRAIAGYSDGTFRPGNNVTRAQLCKIIVLARGWPINTVGGPHFSDAPRTDPFYPFIETAYNHAIILGYSDGTFHPGSNAIRGQISKIVFSAITGP